VLLFLQSDTALCPQITEVCPEASEGVTDVEILVGGRIYFLVFPSISDTRYYRIRYTDQRNKLIRFLFIVS